MICLLPPVCRRWSGGATVSPPEAVWRISTKRSRERDGGPKWGHPLRRKTGLEKPGQARLLYRRRLQFEPRGAARKEE